MPTTVDELPTMERQAEAVASSPLKDTPEPVEQEKIEATRETLSLSVPSISMPSGYIRRRIDVRRMTAKQASALRAIQSGLEDRGAKLENGKHVSTGMHAIQWILENIQGK